jgi:hypothetical protein
MNPAAGVEISLYANNQASAALRQVQNELSGMTGVAGRVGSAFKTAFAAISTGYVFNQIKQLTDAALRSVEALSSQAQNLGMSTQQLQQWKQAAAEAGVNTDKMAGALVVFSQRISESSDAGSESAAVFKAMGISVRDANGELRPTGEILGDVADKFASYADGADKTTLAIKLFGRGNAELIQMLNEGRAGVDRAGESLDRMGARISLRPRRPPRSMSR